MLFEQTSKQKRHRPRLSTVVCASEDRGGAFASRLSPYLFGALMVALPLVTPEVADATSLVELSEQLADLSGEAQQSVVSISVIRRERAQGRSGASPGQQGAGSGVIIDSQGYVVTNHHVVDDAETLEVRLWDGRTFGARLVGSDPDTDIAVLQLESPPATLREMPWGDSDTLRIGEITLAIGNPFGLSSSVSMGIVSATGRERLYRNEYGDFIQTDAAINPGNSGGALVNASGELVGVNTAIYSRSGGSQGIGFAVPSVLVRRVADDLIEFGRVRRGWLGVHLGPVEPGWADRLGLESNEGVLVSRVNAGSPAEQGDLRAGDIICSVEGESVNRSSELRNRVAMAEPNTTMDVGIIRDGERQTLEVRLGDRHEATQSQGLLGLSVVPIQVGARALKDSGALVVSSVDAGSSAFRAGLRSGDILLRVNGGPVSSEAALAARFSEGRSPWILTVVRGNAVFEVALAR